MNSLISEISPFTDYYLNTLTDLEINNSLDPPKTTFDKFWDDINNPEKFSYSGYKTIEVKFKQTNDNGNKQEEFVRSESLNLSLIGNLLDVTMNVDLNQTSQDLQDNRQYFRFSHQIFDIECGDFQSDFLDLTLLNYQDQIKGLKGDLFLGNQNLGVIISNPRGAFKKDVFYGNDSQGPYIVKYYPVVTNSEIVKLEGEILEKDHDYLIDYNLGKITFIRNIVTTEQQVIVTYETSNTNYLDSINGLKYGYNGIDNITTLVGYLKKKGSADSETGTISEEVEVAVVKSKYENTDLMIEGEFGLSKANLDISKNNSITGPAFHVKSTNTLGEWQNSFYLTKLTSSFTPIDNNLYQSGDTLYGVSTLFNRPNSLGIELDYHKKSIHQNETPIDEHSFLFGNKIYLLNLPFSNFYSTKSYLEWPEIKAQGNKYLQDIIASSTELSTDVGKFGALINYENKNYLNNYANSYIANTIGGNYSVQALKELYFAIENNQKNKKMYQLNNYEQENRFKISSRLDIDRKYELRAFYENIFFTDKPNSIIVNLSSILNPIKEITLNLAVNKESLRELYNYDWLDTEKNEYNYQVKIYPIKDLKIDLNFKPKEKHFKTNNFFIYNNQINNYSFTFPILPKAPFSYLFKNQKDIFNQVKYYPKGLFLESYKNIDTNIFKWRFLFDSNTQLELQYEISSGLYQELAATTNPVYNYKDEFTNLAKANYYQDFQDFTLEIGLKDYLVRNTKPEASYKREDYVDLGAKLYYLKNFIIYPKNSLIYTDYNLDKYFSLKPEIEITYSVFTNTELHFNYYFLKELKQNTNNDQEKFTFSLKSEIINHFLLDLAISLENKIQTNYHNFEAIGKFSFML